MTDLPSASTPVLSICVPTYNRAAALKNLLSNLQVVKARFGDQIEICVSNNHSSDETASVIADFASSLSLRVRHQERNIGGTLNLIAVAQLGTGRWNVLVGDDDELLPDGLALLLDYLSTRAEAGDWILAAVADADGRDLILKDLPPGRFDMAGCHRIMLRTSLHPYGFMGTHVFPAAAKAMLAALSLEQARPWPHIATLLRMPLDCHVHVFKPPVMIQAKGGAKLFWNAGDLARITLSKLRILSHADAAVPGRQGFHHRLMLRELYSLTNLGLLVAWKLYEPTDFDAEALQSYIDGWRRTGGWLPLALPHVLATLVLHALPHRLLAGLFKAVGRGHFIGRYAKRKQELQAFDGIKRGI